MLNSSSPGVALPKGTVHSRGAAGVGGGYLQGSLLGSRELEVTVHVTRLAAKLNVSGVVLALAAGVEGEAFNGKVDIGDIGIYTTQSAQGILPV